MLIADPILPSLSGRVPGAAALAGSLLLLVLASCSSDSSSSIDYGGYDGDAFWEEIQADDYRTFDRAPGYETTQDSASGIHGDYVDIYVNSVIAEALDGGAELDEWPVDSVIVKEGFRPQGELLYVAGMKKFDAGWFWAEYDADGAEIASGDVSVCTGCHGDSSNDSVWAFSLP